MTHTLARATIIAFSLALSACGGGGGTGMAWGDAAPHLRQNNIATYGQVNLHWRF